MKKIRRQEEESKLGKFSQRGMEDLLGRMNA
jgi:hypothetical protein